MHPARPETLPRKIHAHLQRAVSRSPRNLTGARAKEQELSVTGPCRDLYLNDPCIAADHELQTELQIPLDPGRPGS
jgi:hypothetical protein